MLYIAYTKGERNKKDEAKEPNIQIVWKRKGMEIPTLHAYRF